MTLQDRPLQIRPKDPENPVKADNSTNANEACTEGASSTDLTWWSVDTSLDQTIEEYDQEVSRKLEALQNVVAKEDPLDIRLAMAEYNITK